jgi:hypothetical protein
VHPHVPPPRLLALPARADRNACDHRARLTPAACKKSAGPGLLMKGAERGQGMRSDPRLGSFFSAALLQARGQSRRSDPAPQTQGRCGRGRGESPFVSFRTRRTDKPARIGAGAALVSSRHAGSGPPPGRRTR